ncbi:MAG: glycosyltransferase family 2 protein [Microthrixaceae bacterium]
MPRLSIVIVNWNGEDLLPGCLEPLESAGFDVIVVDNGSTDGSLALLRSRYSWVRVVANTDNRGFAVANNQGIADADGEYVLLLNNDTVPNVVALETVVAFLDEHPDVGVAGPSVADPDGSPQPSCGPGPSLGTELLARTMLHRLLPGIRARAPSRTQRVDWVTGAVLFVRRALARDVGGLDEGMFMFYEDLDLCARARERGFEVWFVATPPIVHIGGASRRKVEAESLVHSYRSTARFFARHGPAWRRQLLRVLTIPEMALRSLLWSVLALAPSRRAAARSRLQAYRTILRLALTDRAGSTGAL